MSGRLIPMLDFEKVEEELYGERTIKIYTQETTINGLVYLFGTRQTREGSKYICVRLRESKLGELPKNHTIEKEGV